MSKRLKITVLVVMALVNGMIGISYALPTYLSNFNATYGTAATALDTCFTCHAPSGPPTLNPYGTDLKNAGFNFQAIENLDSDGDGFTNIAEINARTFPGDPTSYPVATPTPTPVPTPAPAPTPTLSMQVPVGQQTYTYLPVASPSLTGDGAQAKPIGVGPVAEGGNTLTVRVTLGQFSGPVDVYLMLYLPALDSSNVYLMKTDSTVQSMSAGITPWKQNVTGPIDEVLFSNIPASALPSGQYVIGLLVTPAGSALQNYSLWMTGFDIAGVDGGALYSQNCAGCHGPIATSAKTGRTAAQIQAAIGSIPAMSGFSSLTPAQIQAIANVLSGQTTAAQYSAPPVLMAPETQQGFTVSATASPALDSRPAQANPFGFGPAASGGSSLGFRVALAPFFEPVDLYIGFSLPTQPGNVFLLASGNSVRPLSAGLVPWKANVSGSIDQTFFDNVPVGNLPLGTYSFYLVVTPTGSLNGFYLWKTDLTIGPPSGEALYAQNCAGCHGPLATSAKIGRTAAPITSAINGGVRAMSFLSSLSPAQIQAIADALAAQTPPPPPPPTTNDGASMYSQYCAGCHGSLATSSKIGRTAAQISAAINGGVPAMSGLSSLTLTQISAIASALASQTPPPPTTPGPTRTPPAVTDGPTLYAQNCAGCHGPLATSAKAGRTAAQISAAINGGVSAMSGLSSLTSTQISAIASALASQTPPPPTTNPCTSYTYTWGACVSGTQTATSYTGSPANCTGTPSPWPATQSCLVSGVSDLGSEGLVNTLTIPGSGSGPWYGELDYYITVPRNGSAVVVNMSSTDWSTGQSVIVGLAPVKCADITGRGQFGPSEWSYGATPSNFVLTASTPLVAGQRLYLSVCNRSSYPGGFKLTWTESN